MIFQRNERSFDNFINIWRISFEKNVGRERIKRVIDVKGGSELKMTRVFFVPFFLNNSR